MHENLPVQEFNGILDSATREHLKNKRLQLGLNQVQLAQYLRVSPATVKKWEDGSVTCCQERHTNLLQRFFHGDFDANLQGRITMPEELAVRFKTMPKAMREFVRKAALIHTLCDNRTDIRLRLQDGINRIIRKYTGSMLAQRQDKVRAYSHYSSR